MQITGKNGIYDVVIGLEVHAQIKCDTKLFSSSGTKWDAMPNHNASFVDLAMPGMLPVLNIFAIKQAIKAGIAINGTINKISRFDRKHYFYPDLPQGYQITQFYLPLVQNGFIEITGKKIRINRIHIEQDAGKLVHDLLPHHSSVDYNRAGVPLMEIVSEPDIRSPEEACEYVKALRAILRATDSSDADMEKGNFRCDINISVMPAGSTVFGPRCEVKNINSIRSITRAIQYEANRHVEVVESGGKIVQQTMLFDVTSGKTRPLRNKEDADDYRYFPDPDLLPVVLTEAEIEEIRHAMPELPVAKKDRYISQFGLSEYDAGVLTSDFAVSNFFEKALEVAKDGKSLAGFITTELFGRLNKLEIEFEDCNIPPQYIGEIIHLIKTDVISSKGAKDVLGFMIEHPQPAIQIVEQHNLKQVGDENTVRNCIRKIIDANKAQAAEFKSGKDRLFGFFVGLVMREIKANPEVVNKILREELSK